MSQRPIPLLILSDAPSCTSGLGRICRDLALRLHAHCSDIFRIATFGYGSPGSIHLPFPQYYMTQINEWVTPDLPVVWKDFAGTEPGVIFTIWDASRMLWFARPDLGTCEDPRLRQFVQTATIQKWGYFPIDAIGPNWKLSVILRECMLGYDRILLYSDWAAGIAYETLGEEAFQKRYGMFLPHGIDTNVFYPENRAEARQIFHHTLRFTGPKIEDNERIIGIVATNQTRKDFGLAIGTINRLKGSFPFRLYIQTDTLERAWSIPALLNDYDLTRQAIVNCVEVPDEVMRWIYSACDITLGIGAGEGFGYPIFESLACGCPVLTGSYGGQAEWLSRKYLIATNRLRLDGIYNCFRPVFYPEDWAPRLTNLGIRPLEVRPSLLPEALDWNILWPKWETWFRQAHQTLQFGKVPAQARPSTLVKTDTDGEDSGRSPSAFPEEPAEVAYGGDSASVTPDHES